MEGGSRRDLWQFCGSRAVLPWRLGVLGSRGGVSAIRENTNELRLIITLTFIGLLFGFLLIGFFFNWDGIVVICPSLALFKVLSENYFGNLHTT